MEEFEVGEIITILERPSLWASKLSDNCPLNLEYPITIKVLDIQDDETYFAMLGKDISTGKYYGFDYGAVVIAGFKSGGNQLKMSSEFVLNIIRNL